MQVTFCTLYFEQKNNMQLNNAEQRSTHPPPKKINKDSEVLLLFEVNEDLYVRQKKL